MLSYRAQVRMYVEEQQSVPWDTLNVIVADVTYGGRVTDIWDKRTIASIMRLYFNPGVLEDSYRFRCEHYVSYVLYLCVPRSRVLGVMHRERRGLPRLCGGPLMMRALLLGCLTLAPLLDVFLDAGLPSRQLSNAGVCQFLP